MTDDNGNGSQGRFLRIEDKLDIVVESVNRVEVRLTAIETAAAVAKVLTDTNMTQLTLKWMKYGVILALVTGVGSILTLYFINH